MNCMRVRRVARQADGYVLNGRKCATSRQSWVLRIWCIMCYDLSYNSCFIKVHIMTTLNLRLTDQIDQQLSQEAQRENRTRSEVAREALAWYLTEMKKSRFMNQLVEEARAAYSNKDIRREALEIAEEFQYAARASRRMSLFEY